MPYSALAVKRQNIYRAFRECAAISRDASIKDRLDAMNGVLDELTTATPRLLMTVFPPTKTFGGDKWNSKDYFSTMQAVDDYGIDREFGEDGFEFLWDYMNDATMSFVVFSMSALSAAKRAQGEKGLMEQFCEDNGISAFHKGVDGNGREWLVDDQTGEITPIIAQKPKMPRWWKVIDGGKRDQM